MFEYATIIFLLVAFAYLDAFSHLPVSVAECKEGRLNRTLDLQDPFDISYNLKRQSG
jgi:hypothetical protein